MAVPADRQAPTPQQYYRDAHVRHAMRRYCGALSGNATAAYVVGLDPDQGFHITWDRSPRVPPAGLPDLWDRGCDISRSMWDAEQLLFLFDIDYQNVDQPAEPYLRPAEVFVKIEPVYRATSRVLARFDIHTRPIMTGRGYQFTGRIPLEAPLVGMLAALTPQTPTWYTSLDARRPPGVTTPMTSEQARASVGLGLLTEYLAHLVVEAAQPESRIPVVFNGTIVGNGFLGRECSSLDFSHAGDPLDGRYMRVVFSTYQWHRIRPDIFGWVASTRVPPLSAIPRGRESLLGILAMGHGLEVGLRAAARDAPTLPDVTDGLDHVLRAYRASPLATFHHEYLEACLDEDRPVRFLDLTTVPPCVAAPLLRPNDLLLKPAQVQHVVRGLMGRGWTPPEIARLVQAHYEAPNFWGDRWTRLHARTRAEFDVRVFAGLFLTGHDPLVDFNCVSAQEKELCPGIPCGHDLRRDRDRLNERTT